jgi:ABC-type multidrug transport system fused ATPase/permease subunit
LISVPTLFAPLVRQEEFPSNQRNPEMKEGARTRAAATPNRMKTLQLEHISYLYSAGTPFEMRALDDVNLTIRGGTVTGLIGHTGSGKSTLVQLLNGLNRPTDGRILLDGEDIWARPKEISRLRYRVGLVMQYPEYQLFEETVRADIAYGQTAWVDRKVPQCFFQFISRAAGVFFGFFAAGEHGVLGYGRARLVGRDIAQPDASFHDEGGRFFDGYIQLTGG